MFITWVLATASGLFGTKPGDALDVMFHSGNRNARTNRKKT